MGAAAKQARTHDSCLAACSARCTVPAQVIAHSVGTWNAYEFLRLALREGLPMPRKVFLSGGCLAACVPAASPLLQPGQGPLLSPCGLEVMPSNATIALAMTCSHGLARHPLGAAALAAAARADGGAVYGE